MRDEERKRILESNRALVKDWEPRGVFAFFADFSAVPRESGHVDLSAAFLQAFAVAHGLKHERDAVGNVIIRKPAQRSVSTEGVILQAHQDMVCVKNADVDHDFAVDPIELTHENGWLGARGTTLGADDGIGVALALGVLADKEHPHPPLEALFTVDEETAMVGAKTVRPESLRGEILINLDAEDLGIAYVSSAAGVESNLRLPITRARGFAKPEIRRVAVSGLKGGHSGIEIHTARANAYVLLARFLAEAKERGVTYALHCLEQGEGRGAYNAIADRAVALVSLPSGEEAAALDALAAQWEEQLRNEYRSSDPGVHLRVEPGNHFRGLPEPLDDQCRERLLSVLRLLPLGVFRFAQTEDLARMRHGELLVETSCNLGIARAEPEAAVLCLLARGSTRSVLDDIMRRIADLAAMAGGSLEETNRTAGWEMPARPSRVQRLFMEQGLRCLGVHAGLECGCLVQAFAEAGRHLDAVSVGPDLKDVHSPKERLRVESVQKLWEQLLAVLAAL